MPLDTHIGLRAFADELARCGLRHACTSPGSRSTPLVLALVREPRIRCTSHIDERSGGFFALGQAKATHRPSALACTSGTAAANYLPAVVEAYEARVPLLVLTADRPPELRDVGAGQTIDQVKLYGRNAKWFLEVDEAPATPERLRWMRQLAARAWSTALAGRPGPVHLNFVLREPLVPGGELPPLEDAEPATRRRPPDPRPPLAVARELEARPRAVIVAGGGSDGPAVARFAQRCGLPLLADPLSGARRGDAIAHYDALLRHEAWADAHRPDLVLRVGDLPTSKPLRQWLAALPGARQVALADHFALHDPAGVVDEILPGDSAALDDVATVHGDETWLGEWRAAEQRAIPAMARALGDGVSEPLAVARLWERLPSDATLVVASSMPIRDVETFAASAPSPPRVLSNRGANGIDGTVSTALGVASACDGGPVVLQIGDVALLHDVGGLLAARRLDLDLLVVLFNNDGGGIFHFLPVAGERDAFEEHVATPHGVDFAHAAALYGFEHERPGDMPAFEDAIGEALARPGRRIVELRTDRDANVEIHRRVWESVRGAL